MNGNLRFVESLHIFGSLRCFHIRLTDGDRKFSNLLIVDVHTIALEFFLIEYSASRKVNSTISLLGSPFTKTINKTIGY